MFKRLVSLIIVFTFMFTMFFSFPVSAYSGLVSKNTFILKSFGDKKEYTENYYYSDSFFDQSGTVENEHLRTLSAVMSFSAPYIFPEQDIVSLLSDIGFGSFKIWDMDNSSVDTMGTVIAQKNIKGIPVVAVILRGDNYYHEWASNFMLGSEGDAKGFSNASLLVADRINEYIRNSGMKSAKIWITGYSRAGAVANLTGAYINENSGKFQTDKNNIYVYTFECPKAAAEPVEYQNIFNIIDLNDCVPYVYPNQWNMERHGVTRIIGDSERKIMAKSFKMFDSSHVQDVSEVSQSEFLEDFIRFLSENISRDRYVEYAESCLINIGDKCLSLTDDELSVLIDFLKLTSEYVKDDPDFISSLLPFVAGNISDKAIETLSALIIRNAEKARDSIDPTVNDEVYNAVCDSVKPLITAFGPLVNADMTSQITVDGEKTYVPLYHILTFAENVISLIEPHFNMSVFTYLKSMDSYYGRKDENIIGDADMSGYISIRDSGFIQNDISKISPLSDTAALLSDADDDGSITVVDATAVQCYCAKLSGKKNTGMVVLVD